MGFNDALDYFQTLKETLDPDEYEAIYNALNDFRRGRICAADLIATANRIFLGDKELISGFNSFLPEEYRIKPSSHGQYNWFDIKKASVDFFNEIRRTYSYDNDETYRKFIGIMESFDLGNVGVNKVDEEVDALFKDNPALYLEFTRLFVGFEEDRTRKQHRNQDSPSKKRSDHEVKLFEWEDRLFEMDMVRSSLESTISKADNFLGKSGSEIKDYFGIKEITCIENLYGEAGEDIVELLWSDPVNVLKRVVLPRLRQKLHESVDFLQDNAAYIEPALSC